MKSARPLVLAAAMATATLLSSAAFADGSAKYPPFASIAEGKEMLSRDEINKLDEKKYPKLKGLKSHFTDADLDHDGTINKYEYDLYMANPHD
ncbi:hypothetical protein QFZ41_000480 [Luteibacter sp. W1I16]|jgi:hypothetical protein|uniref:hypothetical protein n=1 Tax=Luteibacter sp. W1I16 TaxID=3373922 RepID=UPI003D1B9656